MKKVMFNLFLVLVMVIVLSPIIWVIVASFIEDTQAPFLIERIFVPEKLKSRINNNELTINYKIKSLEGEKTFKFGRELANRYIMIEYSFGAETGTFEESIIYNAYAQPLDIESTEKKWLIYFQLDGSANIDKSTFLVNKKALLTFFNVITVDNYKNILWDSKFRNWLANSVVISLMTAVLSVLLAFFAGYAFSRYQFPGRKISLMWVLATQLFPLAMMIVPFYILAAKVFPTVIPGLEIVNTRWGLIIIYSATALPFSIWMLKGYFDTIPIDLEEAASIDGASLGQLLFLILFPITRPAVFTAFLFAVVQSWNEYAIASMFMTDPDKLTLPVGLKALMGGNSQQIALFAAGAVIVSIPIIVLFLSMKKELVEGATLGAVKG